LAGRPSSRCRSGTDNFPADRHRTRPKAFVSLLLDSCLSGTDFVARRHRTQPQTLVDVNKFLLQLFTMPNCATIILLICFNENPT
jgi:hypothetical protein